MSLHPIGQLPAAGQFFSSPRYPCGSDSSDFKLCIAKAGVWYGCDDALKRCACPTGYYGDGISNCKVGGAQFFAANQSCSHAAAAAAAACCCRCDGRVQIQMVCETRVHVPSSVPAAMRQTIHAASILFSARANGFRRHSGSSTCVGKHPARVRAETSEQEAPPPHLQTPTSPTAAAD